MPAGIRLPQRPPDDLPVTVPTAEGPIEARLPYICCWIDNDHGGHERGWYQRTATDCLRAAVATCTQVPYHDVPELDDAECVEGDAGPLGQAARLSAWAAGLGLRVRFHDNPPIHLARWIAVTPRLPVGARHTFVAEYDRIHFDPGDGIELPEGFYTPPMSADYGISFEREDEP